MLKNNKIIGMLCGLMLMISQPTMAIVLTTSDWGSHGDVANYYYGEAQTFQYERSLFEQGYNPLEEQMSSTSSSIYEAGSVTTAASSIAAGSTLADYQTNTIQTNAFTPGVPDVKTPIGDGWDVILFLALLAAGYGLYLVKRKSTLA